MAGTPPPRSYCPLLAYERLKALLCTISQKSPKYRCAPTSLRFIAKGGKPLEMHRVLGLVVEQALKAKIATGSVHNGALSLVVVSGAHGSCVSPEGHVGVPLSLEQQKGIAAYVEDLWGFLAYVGFHVLGVDVPYLVYGTGQARQSYDVIGVFSPGGHGPQNGAGVFEHFLTQGDWDGAAVRKKRDEVAADFGQASSLIQHKFMITATYEAAEPGKHLAIERRVFQLVDGEGWVRVFGNIDAVPPLRMTRAEQEFKQVMDRMGRPLKARCKFGPRYPLGKFLRLVACDGHTDQVAQQLRKKGITGIRKYKVSHGSGGARKRKGGPKIGSVWACGQEALLQAYKHIALKTL